MLLPLVLGSSPHLPVSVCGTGTYIQFLQAFLVSVLLDTSLLYFSLLLADHVFPLPWLSSTSASLASFKYIRSAGISTCYPSDTPFGLSLGPDLPQADEPSLGNLRFSTARILTLLSLLIPAFSLLPRPYVLSIILHPTTECSSTATMYLIICTLLIHIIRYIITRNFGVQLSPGNFPRNFTRPVSYYALFE